MNANNINFNRYVRDLKREYPSLTDEQIKLCLSTHHKHTYEYTPTELETKYGIDKTLKEASDNIKQETMITELSYDKLPLGRPMFMNYDRYHALQELKNNKEIIWLEPLEYHRLQKEANERIIYVEFAADSYPDIKFNGIIVDDKHYMPNIPRP